MHEALVQHAAAHGRKLLFLAWKDRRFPSTAEADWDQICRKGSGSAPICRGELLAQVGPFALPGDRNSTRLPTTNGFFRA
jgi:hypothetical protein